MIGNIEKLKRGFRGVLDSVEAKNIEKKRTRYLEQLRARNSNHSFTLITNNCVGGVISHNLGEQFRSPTVNLFISGDQFLPFVKGVRLYLSDETELIQVKDNTRNYPVGRLHPANDTLEDIFIYFQHYKTFENAKEKWIERTRRVNWDNVFYIWEFYEGLHNDEHLREFDALDIKKTILLHEKDESIQNGFVINEGEVTPGKILNYDDSGVRRYLDQFDYVSFLNT